MDAIPGWLKIDFPQVCLLGLGKKFGKDMRNARSDFFRTEQ